MNVDLTNLKIDCMYPISGIINFSLQHTYNQHILVRFHCFADKQLDTNGRTPVGSIVDIKVNNERWMSLIVTELTMEMIGGMTHLYFTCASGSWLLDREKVYRSFQNVTMTYEDLIKSVLKKYEVEEYVSSITDNIKISTPIIQYNETDWEFLTRIASHLGGVVYASIRNAAPCLFLGLPQSSENLDSINCKQYRKAGEMGMEFQSDEYFPVGTRVNQRYNIAEVRCSLQSGLSCFDYEAVYLPSIKIERQENQDMIGLSVIGKIIERQDDRVKLWLAIDEKQDKDTAYLFRYAPNTVSWLYAIPELGEMVYLYLSDSELKDACVTEVPIRSQAHRLNMRPSDKNFETLQGKSYSVQARRKITHAPFKPTGSADAVYQAKMQQNSLVNQAAKHSMPPITALVATL